MFEYSVICIVLTKYINGNILNNDMLFQTESNVKFLLTTNGRKWFCKIVF